MLSAAAAAAGSAARTAITRVHRLPKYPQLYCRTAVRAKLVSSRIGGRRKAPVVSHCAQRRSAARTAITGVRRRTATPTHD